MWVTSVVFHMMRLAFGAVLFSILCLCSTGCSSSRDILLPQRDEVRNDELGAIRQKNLRKAAQYPWKDNGTCAVNQASGEWRDLVRICFAELDLSRIHFQDLQGRCAVANAVAAGIEELVGVCLIAQPEVAVGTVVIVGSVAVGSAIVLAMAGVLSVPQPCIHIGTKGEGSGKVTCIYLCGEIQQYIPRRGTSAACMDNIPTYLPLSP